MSDTKYNGWANYETWLLNLWFDNFTPIFKEMTEEGTFDAMDMDKDEILTFIMHYIKEYVYEFVYETQSHGGFVDDLINASLGSVDFREIAKHYIDDVLVDLKESQTLAKDLPLPIEDVIDFGKGRLTSCVDQQAVWYQGPQ